ncbi:hypothetical protein VV11_008370 [Trichodesmium erythraeum 21-75]|nr:hypothetical protein [Trichodesmium erythraeum 21-75]
MQILIIIELFLINKIGDNQQAIDDCTEAIKLEPTDARYYRNRAMLRYDTEDNQGGLDDLQKAADIYQKQGTK